MKKLDLRSDKGRLGWRKDSEHVLFNWLLDEVKELHLELIFESEVPGEDLEKIKDEAIDVANLAMMIYDKINNLDGQEG